MKHRREGPIYLNLLRIRMPVTAWVSIAHRLSGVLLFLAIPLMAFLLDRSLSSESGYQWVVDLAATVWFQIPLGLVLWSVIHHLFAGIRFLLIDIDIGVELASAKTSAWVVNIAGFTVTVIVLVLLQ